MNDSRVNSPSKEKKLKEFSKMADSSGTANGFIFFYWSGVPLVLLWAVSTLKTRSRLQLFELFLIRTIGGQSSETSDHVFAGARQKCILLRSVTLWTEAQHDDSQYVFFLASCRPITGQTRSPCDMKKWWWWFCPLCSVSRSWVSLWRR